jgi:hypothetical protein
MNAQAAEFRLALLIVSLLMIKRHHIFRTFDILTALARRSWKESMCSHEILQ